jgi:hypothetical protein
MAIIDLFSTRQKQLRGEVTDVYFYDQVPMPLRVQIVQIIRASIGKDRYDNSYSIHKEFSPYEFIHKVLCREYGVFTLATNEYSNESDEECVINHFLNTNDIDHVIDIIELSFRYIKNIIGENIPYYQQYFSIQQEPDDAIVELNYRFKQHGFGFQFEGEMIRVDSTFMHSEITKPTINLLNKPLFTGANEEYLKAHEHYRNGRNKECLTECLKAFESSMKTICTAKGWAFNQTDTAKKLIQICFQNGLVPPFTQNQFTSLQNLLESGIPTIRNKLGGHGQGALPQKVDDGMTRYGLNLTGANIIFLIEQSAL